VATPETKRPTTLEEAVAELKRDPTHPIRLVVDGMEIELRRPTEPGTVAGSAEQSKAGDVMAGVEPWEGESTDELLRIIRQGRELDDPGFEPRS
jgi:hypothetical protein